MTTTQRCPKCGNEFAADAPGGLCPACLLSQGQFSGSVLGSASFIMIPDDVCILQAQLRISEFFAHESCGKCIPCREGTPWLAKTVRRIENGQGREEDLPLLLDICDNIAGRSFCVLGDFATSNIVATIKYFFDDYEEHIRQRGCPYHPRSAEAVA